MATAGVHNHGWFVSGAKDKYGTHAVHPDRVQEKHVAATWSDWYGLFCRSARRRQHWDFVRGGQTGQGHASKSNQQRSHQHVRTAGRHHQQAGRIHL